MLFQIEATAGMSEKIWYLKRCNLFESLDNAALARIEARARWRKFPRNSPIYLPADEADAVLLLATGRAKICSFTPEGKQAILAFIEPGELFGELAVFGGEAREEYAEAVEASQVVLIPGEVLLELLESRPSLALGITRLMGLRRRRIERRLRNLLFRSNRERLVHLLLELAERYGRRDGAAVRLDIRLSHQDLANVIGSTRETVTVVLGEMQAEGLLKLGRRRIEITDLDALARSVATTPPPLASEANAPAAPRAVW